MTRLMSLRNAFAVGLVVFGMATPVCAAPPTLVISLRSIDELLEAADLVGDTLGVKGLSEIVEQNLKVFTGGKGLAGIDREKPLGLFWNIPSSTPGDMGTGVIFLPVTDAEEFKKLISMFVPDLKDNDGQWTMTVQGQELFAKVADDYCFISNSVKGLSDVPDPDKIVNDDYDIAIDVNVASIPKPLKDTFLESVEKEARKNLEAGPRPKNDAEAAGRTFASELLSAMLKSMTNDGDKMTVGVSVDDETRLASIDLGITGKSNTTLSKSLAVFAKTTPAFAAVTSDSSPLRLAISHPTTGIIDQFDVLMTGVRKSTDADIDRDPKLDDAGKKTAKDAAKRLWDIVQATVKSGSLHSILVLEEGDNNLVRIFGGTKVAKGDDAAKLFDEAMKLSKENPDFAKVKPDVAKHAGARIHSIEGTFDDKQAALFGDNPAHFAIRADSIWVSLGSGNLEALKSALDLSGKKASQTDVPVSLRAKPATLITLFERNNAGLIKRAEALAGEPGDILDIEVAPIEKGGIKLSIDFGIDLIKLLAGG